MSFLSSVLIFATIFGGFAFSLGLRSVGDWSRAPTEQPEEQSDTKPPSRVMKEVGNGVYCFTVERGDTIVVDTKFTAARESIVFLAKGPDWDAGRVAERHKDSGNGQMKWRNTSKGPVKLYLQILYKKKRGGEHPWYFAAHYEDARSADSINLSFSDNVDPVGPAWHHLLPLSDFPRGLRTTQEYNDGDVYIRLRSD